MNPLIFYKQTSKNDNFEASKLKKALINSLEIRNASYVNSILDETYDVIHFLNLEDVAYYSNSIKKSVKKVISLFYCEEDQRGRILEENKRENLYVIKANDVEILNKLDCIFVPTEKAKEYLLSFNVKTRIEVLYYPLRSVKFNLENNVLKNVVYRYFQIDESSIIVTVSLYFKDYEAFKKIKELALSFPKIKFIVLTEADPFKSFSLKTKKLFKQKINNIIFASNLNDDIYNSLFFNSKMYINISSSYGNIIELFDAMASKTQIFTLNYSSFCDITIDKETSYNYNNLDLLKSGINEYLSGLIESTTKKAYEFSKEANVNKVGEKLIDIYKDILEE